MKGWTLLGGAIAVVGVTTAALPSVLSTDWGRNTVLSIANSLSDSQLELESLSLSWSNGQELTGLSLTKDGQQFLAVEELSTDASLVGLATGSRSIGKTRIVRPKALLADRHFEPDHEASSSSAATPTGLHLPFLGELEIEAGEVTVEREGHPPVIIRNLNALVSADEAGGPLTATLSGETEQQGVIGSVAMEGEVAGFDEEGHLAISFDEDGLPHLGSAARIALDLDINQLPLAALSGALADALGGVVDVKVENRLDEKGLLIDTSIEAKNLKARVEGRSDNGTFSLTEPAEAALTLSPEYLESLTGGMSFNRPVNTEIRLDKLSFPLDLSAMSFDMRALDFLAYLTADDLSFVGDEASGRTELVNIQATAESKANSSLLSFSTTADLFHDNRSGKLALNAQTEHLLDATAPFSATLNLEGSALPIGIADRFLGLDGLVADALGNSASMKLAGKASGNSFNGILDFSSDRSRIEGLEIEKDGQLRVRSRRPIQLDLPRAFTSRYVGPNEGVDLPDHLPLTITLKKLDLPAEEFAPADSHIDLKIENDPFVLRNVPETGTVEVGRGSLTLAGPLDRAAFKQTLPLTLPEQNSRAALLLGKEIQTEASATLKVKPENRLDLPDLHAKVKGEHSRAEVTGSLMNRTDLTLSTIDLSHTLTPLAYQSLMLPASDATRLVEPLTLTTTLAPIRLQLDEIDPNTLTLSGKAKANQFVVGKGESVSAAMTNVALDWDLDVPVGIFTSQLQATTRAQGKSGSVSGSVAISEWRHDGLTDFGDARLISDLSFSRFPVPFLEVLSGYPFLDTLIGENLELEFDSNIKGLYEPEGRMTLQMEGDAFTADSDLAFSNGVSLYNNKPTSVNWTLTPARFDALRTLAGSPHPIRLQRNANVKLAIDALRLPWSSDFEPSLSEADVTVAIDRMVLLDERHQQTTTFDEFKATLKGKDLSRLLDFSLQGKGIIGNSDPMSLAITGRIGEPLAGTWVEMSKEFKANARNIPASLVADSFGAGRELSEQMEALFGDRLDLTAEGHINKGYGPLSASLNAENSRMNFSGELQDYILTLKEPLTAEIDVTPELSRTVLKNINPLLVTAVSGEQPVRMRIEPYSVRVPMKEWDVSKVQFGKATVEIGKVVLTNGGPVSLIVGILQSGSLKGRDRMQAWFTPQYLHMNNGILEVERMDMLLADNIHMATWGKVDLARDQIDMRLGLPAHTLRQSFGIKGVPSSQWMQVPIRGTLDDPKINTGAAIARITAMRTSQMGGDEGKILGGIFGIIGGGGNISDGPAPPATTNPLPWPTPQYEEEQVTTPAPSEEKKTEPKAPKLPEIFDIFRKGR